MVGVSVEKFVAMTPIYDTLAEDEQALAEVETFARTVGWEDALARADGRPTTEPDITREPNPNYGRLLVVNGAPVCGEDGEPLVDHVKLYLFARGWAERT